MNGVTVVTVTDSSWAATNAKYYAFSQYGSNVAITQKVMFPTAPILTLQTSLEVDQNMYLSSEQGVLSGDSWSSNSNVLGFSQEVNNNGGIQTGFLEVERV